MRNAFVGFSPLNWRIAAGIALALALGRTASAQEARVTGTVTSGGGAPVQGAIVRVLGSETTGATTNAAGRYTIDAPANGTLLFTAIGYRRTEAAVNARTTVDVTMERVTILDQVVVTGYTEGQRRAEITGAVASVNLDAVNRQSSASVLQRLDANTSGVRVESSGSPAGRSTVRIRGISSFQNNDPLYVVDGTPVQDSYVNFLNPADISSIQVLKDASAASIYGSRASNGVIIIETVKGRNASAPQPRLRVRTGMATPVRGYDDFLILNSLDYYEVVKQSYLNAGYPIDSVPSNVFGNARNPAVPAYIWPNNCNPNPCSNVDPASYAYPNNLIMPGSAGTNWWDEVFGTGMVSDVNLDVTGGGTANTYAASFNYFDQQGTAAYNRYRRGSVRVNTSFTRRRFTFGENLSLTGERSYGGVGDDNFGEGGILGKNILSQPVVPVRDIGGNFASGKAVGLGNNTNPVKEAYVHKDDINQTGRIFGNVFGNLDITPRVALRSTLGVNAAQESFNQFFPITPENSEPNLTNSINEWQRRSTGWTWTNTLRYSLQNEGPHRLSVLLGQEANKSNVRRIFGSLANLVATDVTSRYIQDVLGDAGTKNVFSEGFENALLSFFGKADYTLADKYVLSFTLRRDGSSNLGPEHRWGTFPAAGLGWHVSEEPFLRDNRVLSDLNLRVGYGITGNQQIPSGRIVAQFGGGRGDTYYDISGSNTGVVTGFRQTALGNEDLRWEESRSINAGADLSLFEGAANVVLDVYQRTTDNLLFDPRLPATAGIASPPIVNIGKMKNTGFDFSVGHQAASWGLNFNGSHYRNRILRIDDNTDFFFGPIATRFGNQVINQVGQPIGSFYGLVADGFFRDAADVTAHADQDGAAPGRIKFRDMNGDGQITLADRTIIGNPHPDFTAGLDLNARRGRWNASATLFGTFGNDVFDAQKEFYIFRNFSTNVRRDLLANSWTPENADNAKYPRLDVNDNYSHQVSSFYVEDGSYVRLRNVQLGYDVPESWARWLTTAQIYLQAENVFTITGYEGLDPALPAANAFGAAGDIRDQYRGVDRGVYPSSRTISIGIVTSF
ncbi:MAG TPA: SusC/RagA family TonB-linked outer membrane protein [Gemmatimonadaceae bacterium]|nr:SusC/RagA family TonB-linked outer membrane protein [Gemmatimonadaceae bacterium]